VRIIVFDFLLQSADMTSLVSTLFPKLLCNNYRTSEITFVCTFVQRELLKTTICSV